MRRRKILSKLKNYSPSSSANETIDIPNPEYINDDNLIAITVACAVSPNTDRFRVARSRDMTDRERQEFEKRKMEETTSFTADETAPDGEIGDRRFKVTEYVPMLPKQILDIFEAAKAERAKDKEQTDQALT